MIYLLYFYLVGCILTLILSLEYIYTEFIDRAYVEVFLFIFIAPLFSWFAVYDLVPMALDLWKVRIDCYIKKKIYEVVYEIEKEKQRQRKV